MADTIYTDISSKGHQFAISGSSRDNGIGIVIPFGSTDYGSFLKQSFTTLDAAKSNIKNLILTMQGERIMHPTLGSDVWNMIMEPMVPGEFEERIKMSIREGVKMWLPYISIDELTVTIDNNNNAVQIGMSLSLKNDPQTRDTLYFSISKGDI